VTIATAATDPGLWESVPPAVWGTLGILGAALLTAAGAVFGTWLTNRRNAKVDAGQLALTYAQGLRDDVKKLEDRVTTLENERNAYRSHAHVLHEWGGYVETSDRPRPIWPVNLPR
jgi:hypothetical protein